MNDKDVAHVEQLAPAWTDQAVRVLVVDDSAVDRTLITAILERSRQSVLTLGAASIAGAIEQLSAHGADCVVLDLQLPDAEGLSGLEQVVAAAPETPVVVLTGTNDDATALAAVAAGAQDYLVKGRFDTPTLVRAIRYAVERQQIQVEQRKTIEELACSEERFRRAFEGGPIGKLLVEGEGTTAPHIVAVNAWASALLGAPDKAMVDSSLADWVLPQDGGSLAGLLHHLQDHPAAPVALALRMVRGDGTAVRVRITASVIGESGTQRETLLHLEPA